jgi:CheY-like chemotaxis protein
VSRILVADDNSNIQKMVALALKDEGIDVVAVGNGDAAMRKIPDLRPDLVLADIFMPVRNGYEVCEFVKSDSRYMSTPVVLLVGAFDPLDEQETQRVRADGVLKKPFVPPDPLINMVKALLAKSNGQKPVSVAAATSVKPAPTAQTTPVPTQPTPSTGTYAATVEPLQQPAPPALTTPALHSQSQAAKEEDSDEVVTAPRDPNLGEPFWATPVEPEEPEEKSETEPEDMIDMHSFGREEPTEEEDEPFRSDSPLLGDDFVAGDQQTMVSQNEALRTPETNPSARARINEDESNVVGAHSKDAAKSSSAPSETSAAIFEFDPTLTYVGRTQNAPTYEQSGVADHPHFAESKALESPVGEDSAMLSLPGVTDSSVGPPVTAAEPRDTHDQVGPLEPELSLLPNREAVITAATEAARLAFSELNRLPGSGSSEEASDQRASETAQRDLLSASAPGATPTSPTPEMIEAVVNRLLERMQPQIMEVVNREVLRPAIEAIVRQEIKKG